MWEKLKTTYREVAEEKLGYKKKKKERWISERTWKLIDARKSAKLSILSASDASELIVLQDSYREIDKQVKKSARTDKRQFIEQKAALAEEAAKKGDSKTVYRLTNEMIGVKPNRTNLVKDENGVLLTDPLMIDERWATHFENLLNRPRINDRDHNS